MIVSHLLQNINHASLGPSNDHVTDNNWLNILAFSLKHNVTGFNGAFKDFEDKSEYHHYCGVCSSYIGSQICSSTQTARQSLELGQFFICMLKVLLENEPITNIYNDQHRDGITDISDGKLYKYLKSAILSFPCHSTVTECLCSSHLFSIWPLLYSVNEVSPEERDKNVILCALWFGSSLNH